MMLQIAGHVDVLVCHDKFKRGSEVILHGLKAEKYNGRRGTIVSMSTDADRKRFAVQLDGGNELFSLKPANLRTVNGTKVEFRYSEDIYLNWLTFGGYLRARGDFKDEYQCINEAIKIDNRRPEAWVWRGSFWDTHAWSSRIGLKDGASIPRVVQSYLNVLKWTITGPLADLSRDQLRGIRHEIGMRKYSDIRDACVDGDGTSQPVGPWEKYWALELDDT